MLFAFNGALNGSTRGIKQVLGMLGAAAGPSGVVALTIMGLTKFDDAVRESAKKLHQAWSSLEERA